MSDERRFLIAPSFARLIQRERGILDRIAEGHFTPKPDRRQLVRVERGRSQLILLTQAEDGSFAEEQTEIPVLQAEALMDLAAGTVAFDRTALSLGGDVEALLDRFLIPQGVDLLTVTIASDPHVFAPLPRFGLEVTDEPAFGAMELALDGAPNVDVMEPSNAALEALLDMLEGRSLYDLRPAAASGEWESTQAAAPSATIQFGPATAATPEASSDQKTGAQTSGDTEEESYESLSIRRLARSLAPRDSDHW